MANDSITELWTLHGASYQHVSPYLDHKIVSNQLELVYYSDSGDGMSVD